MLKRFLEHLEDPERPLLGPNYWTLQKSGLILPDDLKPKIYRIVSHAMGFIFVLTQFLDLYLTELNVDLLINNVKYSMVSVICTVKANTFVLWQRHWKDILEYITGADRYEREIQDETRSKIIYSYTKYCRRITYFYLVLVLVTFSVVVTTPLIRYMTSSESYREAVRNGTEPFPHIYISWVPFDKNSSPGAWVQVFLQFTVSVYGCSVMAAYDASVLVFMVFMGGKFELLRERCKQMFGSGESVICEEEAAKTIRELHRTYVLTMRYSKLLNSLLSPVMFLYVLVCTFMLCTTAFQMTSLTSTFEILLMTEYLTFGVTQLFMFCWQSNVVLVKNDQVSLGPYESEWWSASVSDKHRRSVALLAGQLSRPHCYMAGPFTPLTLASFVTILQGAYSYYTLLRE